MTDYQLLFIRDLSDYEKFILLLIMSNYKCKDISKILGLHSRSIHQLFVRLRKKYERWVNEKRVERYYEQYKYLLN